MKRWIALLMALGMLIALCACGETGTQAETPTPEPTPEPTPGPAALVEKQIDALGEISLDSKDALEAAEAAYAALTPEEQAQVRNLAILQAARLVYDEAAAKQAADDAEAALLTEMEPFVGTWVMEYPLYDSRFELRAGGEYVVNNFTGDWSCDPAAGTLVIGGERYVIFEEDGFTKIRVDSADSSLACVKAEDLDAARAKKYVSIELSGENVKDIIGDPIQVGVATDEWGEPDPYWPVFFYPNLYYAQGLVYIDGEDVAIECADGSIIFAPGFNAIYSPFSSVDVSGRAKGTLWFIRDSYVADNTLEKTQYGYEVRLILTSGEAYSTLWYGSTIVVEGGYPDPIEFYNDHKT